MSYYVYRFLDEDSNILYVGRTKNLSERLSAHFHNGHLPQDCYEKIDFAEFIGPYSEVDAVLIEILLINELQPTYNTKDKYEPDTLGIKFEVTFDWERYKFELDRHPNTKTKNQILCKLGEILEERNISAITLSKSTGVKISVINEVINNKDNRIRKKQIGSILRFLEIDNINDFYYFSK